ncbi:MAG: hypothetical protein HYV23_07335 [Deltaproteobacteria bacterium]|nr:hypothetical protein [Deltaproteobacteria bacterium]
MENGTQRRKARGWIKSLSVSVISLLCFSVPASALTLNVVGPDGEAVTGYRWLLEEDATYQVSPGVPDPDTLAVKFHSSYMPVAASGDEGQSSSIPSDPAKPYFISVLPDSGYTIGGASIKPGQSQATVVLNRLPLPTAQITVLVFEDNQPINNAPNVPAERGLEGFSILLSDAAGRYGQAGGQQIMDAFGNPLGTSYDADGNVTSMGTGIIKTDADGRANIKYLPPGKYGIKAISPKGQTWVQTSTLEGTKTIDAWVKANEPTFFTEFGPPGQHVSVGFVAPTDGAAFLTGGKTITGRVVNLHLSAPPFQTFNAGQPFGHTIPWISIPDVPPGDYQLVVWDEHLDLIIALANVTIEAGAGAHALGDVPVFQWFSRLESRVFLDKNQNGFRDCVTMMCDDPSVDDIGIPEVPVNLRFRDGTIYQSFPTDLTGFVPFDEVFPFFNWLVAEVDFGRLKATGATVVVDAGGTVNADQGWDYPSWDALTPQAQFNADGSPAVNPNTGNNLSRTETGPVLLEAFQGFLGETNVIEWGKAPYGPGENGGITGMVQYSVTRAENDPAYAAAELWEPGIARVQVNLYPDMNRDKAIDDLDGDGVQALADIDNYPFGWRDDPQQKGGEDVDRNDNGAFDLGDALQAVTTDSWDDNSPAGCQGEPFSSYGQRVDCFDGLRNFNQVRPGVFDGGYAFNDVATGTYIVEAVPPRSALGAAYKTVKEEDKNVDFGDEYVPSTLLLPPSCVNKDENGGQGHLVPAELSLFPGIPAPYAGSYRPVCDRKQISVMDGFNAAVNFAMFTDVPVAAHIKGMVLDDLANEFDPNSPQFGEKYAPPWLPISIRDWTGREVTRTYTDEWGNYNALVPSTYTVNISNPSGVSPNMLTTCINDPGPISDPANPGQMIADPFFNRQYSQFCYTFQFMPGATTYLDTPVIPVAAFAGPGQYPLDCEFQNGTPKIYSVTGPNGSGPYAIAGQQLTIVSEGSVPVPNPAYDGTPATPKTINRDYGFGSASGTVSIGNTQLQINNWTPGVITATIPAGTATGELSVTRSDNARKTIAGLTVTVGPIAGSIIRVSPGASIQEAVDIANPGDMVIVPPGNYEELVLMWKPVQLQGWGAGSVTINAVKRPAEKLQLWRDKLASLVTSGAVDVLPAQDPGNVPDGAILPTEEGAAVTVVAKNTTQANGGFGPSPNARIDGFTLTGSDIAGGVVINGYAPYMEVSNNRIINNQGVYGGGIRSGHTALTVLNGAGLEYQNAFNDYLKIHNNHVTQNAGRIDGGGGITIGTGTDFYQVTDNFICGNFTMGEGAGISHLGLSDQGTISGNTVIFNQSFNQGLAVSGGGVLVSGGAPLGIGALSAGSGSVKVIKNVIQGNLAGAGDGGGIRLNRVNGQDVLNNPNIPEAWYTVQIFNNMITNNVSGLAGAGISLQDSARVFIVHNTISNNDSTATAGAAFAPGSPSMSTPQPAGIVARAHSDLLASVFGTYSRVLPYKEFSNPSVVDNIIWHNRSFYFIADSTQNPPFYGLVPDVEAGQPPVYWDLWVEGTATQRFLDPRYSILTDRTGYHTSNISSDPLFVSQYLNGATNQVNIPEATTSIQAQPAFDEGGNFIDVRFGPLTLTGDYHLRSGSPAINRGLNNPLSTFPELSTDFDGQARPNGLRVDIGADERY